MRPGLVFLKGDNFLVLFWQVRGLEWCMRETWLPISLDRGAHKKINDLRALLVPPEEKGRIPLDNSPVIISYPRYDGKHEITN
jgi:hypothetical protein